MSEENNSTPAQPPKKRKPQTKKALTLKEQKFVKEYIANNGNATEALVAAGYNPKNRQTAHAMATEVKNRPAIKNAIAKIILKKYPNSEEIIVDQMHDLLTAPVKMTDGDEGISAGDKLKTLQYYNKMLGHEPATKSAHVRVNVPANGLALPGGFDETLEAEYTEEDEHDPE